MSTLSQSVAISTLEFFPLFCYGSGSNQFWQALCPGKQKLSSLSSVNNSESQTTNALWSRDGPGPSTPN